MFGMNAFLEDIKHFLTKMCIHFFINYNMLMHYNMFIMVRFRSFLFNYLYISLYIVLTSNDSYI